MNLVDYIHAWEWSGMILALALGLLVGIERGWAHREEAPGTRFAGVRTFGLLGLAGGIAGALFADYKAISTIILAACAVLILLGYYRMSQSRQAVSGTTSLGAFITVGCGFLAATGEHQAAIVITVFMVLLLAMRKQLHRLVGHMSEKEVMAIARFALIALVILPLLPNSEYGPFNAWNPRLLWTVVVFVSGFSLVGYVAAKLLGATRGTIATAAAGSLVSSTAVTASLANRIKENGANLGVLYAGISTASVVMFLRTLVLVGILAPFALPTLAVLAVPGIVVSLVATVWLLRQAKHHPPAEHKTVEVKNPFAIGPALILMGMVMVMTLAARWVLSRYGDSGVVVVLAISGTVDVDSAVITMGSLPLGTLQPHMAAIAVLVPMVLNTLFKAATALGIAGWRRGWPGALVITLSAMASLCLVPFVR